MKGHVEDIGRQRHNIVIELGRERDSNGSIRRKRLVRTVHGSKAWARQEMLRLMQELSSGTFIQPAKTTVAGFLRQWLDGRRPAGLSPRTIETYEVLIRRHIAPEIGALLLTELQPLHVQRLDSTMLANGYSAKTVASVHTMLNSALNQAVKWRMIPRNPASDVDRPRIQTKKPVTLNKVDIQRLLDALPTCKHGDLYTLAFFTGMRLGELLGLKWQDFDAQHGCLYVQRSLVRVKGRWLLKGVKSAAGSRLVVLPPRALQLLCRLQEKALSEFVFSRDDGSPLSTSSVTHGFVILSRQLGLDGFRLHDLRHTHASILLRAGVHPKIVQERLGHSSISMTLDTYSHLIPSLQQDAALLFEQVACTNGQLTGSKPASRQLTGSNKSH